MQCSSENGRVQEEKKENFTKKSMCCGFNLREDSTKKNTLLDLLINFLGL